MGAGWERPSVSVRVARLAKSPLLIRLTPVTVSSLRRPPPATVRVREEYEGEAVWDGDVYVFDLTDHPTAEVAYGWSDPVPGTDRRRFYAVLHTGPVDSPENAVRAAIVSEYRGSKSGP